MPLHLAPRSRRDGDTEPELCDERGGPPREAGLGYIPGDSMTAMGAGVGIQGPSSLSLLATLSTFTLTPAHSRPY